MSVDLFSDGLRYSRPAVLALVLVLFCPVAAQELKNVRRPIGEEEMRYWLTNMVTYHGFSTEEVRLATGMTARETDDALKALGIGPTSARALTPPGQLVVLPYPGGRHPRIGFLDGAVEPQRETKLSVFAPWDPSSYVVADFPEAIWSNLGLTYLAHSHVPTLWTKAGVELKPLEWQRLPGGVLVLERTLPNGIAFGTRVSPEKDHVAVELWLQNGSQQSLTDLRVQNCVMLKGAKGFTAQTNDNKRVSGPYSAARTADGKRWVITAWDPLHKAWANERCPCLHSDPKFPDCPPGETRRLRGWLSFYEGNDIDAELARIEATGWRQAPYRSTRRWVRGRIEDAATGRLVPARLYVDDGEDWFFAQATDPAGSAVRYNRRHGAYNSVEIHTTLSAHPFALELEPGLYTVRVERGKEYQPLVRRLRVPQTGAAIEDLRLPLQRWINMPERGWYSGDTHVHRTLEELPNVMLAEDLNVALPLTQWVLEAGVFPKSGKKTAALQNAELIEVDSTHVIHPLNTEYEIFRVGGKNHTLGAVFVLDQKEPLELTAPPVTPIAAAARQQNALLDLDKHSWPWSLMLLPVMQVHLFELANNHHWRETFGYRDWTTDTVPEYMNIEIADGVFTEWGWTEFGFKTYYALLNSGFPMRVSAGSASGVHPVPLGFGRVYVYLADGFSYRGWIDGLRRGQSFVSTGPMLEVTFNGKPPGAEFEARDSAGALVQIRGKATAARPLRSIEIVLNGSLSNRLKPVNVRSQNRFESSFSVSLRPERTSWIAVRCIEEDADDRVRFAHTNPVYVNYPGQPLQPKREEVLYFIRRMDEEIERNRGVLTEKALAEYEQAKKHYGRLLERAQ